MKLMLTWCLFILGATVAGFVQGLTGFAFALIAMSFWVWVLPPQLAAPLVVCASLWCHIISLSQEKAQTQLQFNLILPYVVAGLIGVPLGSYLLHMISADHFKLVLGLFLILWCPMMYFKLRFPCIERAGQSADAVVGFLGGILGGLGGFCGALPSAWVMLKQLTKQQQRYILRNFNFAIQLFTLIAYLLQGTIERVHLPYLAILLISVSLPAMWGAKLFYKISEKRFNQIVLSLLFSSGIFLVLSITLF